MEINRINYEKFFLLYLDRELNSAEMLDVEKFLGENTDLQKEFMLLQQTIFMPEEILFENKESLLRKEEKRRIIPFYRIQMAAAVALMILGSWFIISQIIKIQKSAPATEQATVAKNIEKEDKNAKAENPNDLNAVKNSPANLAAGKETDENKVTGTSSAKSQPVKTVKNNQKGQSPGSVQEPGSQEPGRDIPAESSPALQKSSTALEIQSVAMQAGDAPRPVSTQPGNNAPVLLMALTPKTEPTLNEKALLQEQDFQTDNAISVVALNDPNKGISKFLKKLTRSAPAEDNARKVRVSVFQISY